MPFATCFRLIGILLLLPLSAAPVGASAAGIGRDKGGRPVVLLDGEPVSLGPGVVHHQSREFTEAFDRAGIATIVLSANLGMYHSRLSYFAPLKHMREFWRGYRDYDASQIEALLAPPVAANPRVKILLWLGVDPYPEFGQRHPDSIIRNDRGDALIATTHFARFDAAPPQAGPGKPEHYGISFFSEAYRTEAAEMLSAFIRGVEASPHGGHVIGYLLGGGQDGQQYSWSPPDSHLQNTPENWGDYSPAARRAFPDWLKQRYGGDLPALNSAWKAQMASFTEAAPPPAADLCGVRAFHDPVAERRAYDWKRFLAEGRSDFITGLARCIRRAAGRPVLIGASGGDGGHRRDNTSISTLLRADSVDFLLHQVSYGTRLPPSAGGINAILDSYAVNGKLFLTDMDHRLFTAPRPAAGTLGVVTFNAETVGWAADLEMQRAMWRREYARLWVSGNNDAWFGNFCRPADYDHAGLQEEMRFLRRRSAEIVSRNCLTPQGPPAAEVAFICDESAVDYARQALGEFHMASMATQWREAHLSGVPIRFYYAQDLREGKVPPAKLYVLQNLLDVDEALAGRIRALRDRGATLVLLQGTGYVQLARGQGDRLRDALGLALRQANGSGGPSAAGASITAGHPLLGADEWLPAVETLAAEGFKEPDGLTLTADAPKAAVLAGYPVSRQPSLVVASRGAGDAVFVGAYALSRQLISRLARLSGAWRVAPPDVAVAADDALLMLHPMKSGEVEVQLRRPASLVEIPPGDLRTERGIRHRLALVAGRTYLFRQER